MAALSAVLMLAPAAAMATPPTPDPNDTTPASSTPAGTTTGTVPGPEPTPPDPTGTTPQPDPTGTTPTPQPTSEPSSSPVITPSSAPEPGPTSESPTLPESNPAPHSNSRLRVLVQPTVTLWSAPTTLVAGTTGTATGRLYPEAANQTGFVEVSYRGGWARIATATTTATGLFTVPLSYGVVTPGTYTFRLGVTVDGVTAYTRTWTLTRTDIYMTPGTHRVGATSYRTECGNFSATIKRCRTDVYGQQVGHRSSGFYFYQGWRLVRYTHTTVAATSWRGSYLASPGVHVVGGKLWRVECGTNRSGSRACVADQWQSYISTVRNDGSSGYNWQVGWVFQMMMPFTTAPLTTGNASRATVPSVWTTCTTKLQNQTVTIGRTEHTRIIVDQTSGSYATVSMWFRDRSKACTFTAVYVTGGRIGARGVGDPGKRRAGDDTTPAGTYTMIESHGHVRNPGTELPYLTTTWDDYWVWDQNSAYFNTLRNRRDGGFNAAISQRVRYLSYFEYTIVIDYNRRPVVNPVLGGGIRFHLTDGKPTGGCVAVGMTSLKQTIMLVMPGDKITITR